LETRWPEKQELERYCQYLSAGLCCTNWYAPHCRKPLREIFGAEQKTKQHSQHRTKVVKMSFMNFPDEMETDTCDIESVMELLQYDEASLE
jgi:hypothetical protein